MSLSFIHLQKCVQVQKTLILEVIFCLCHHRTFVQIHVHFQYKFHKCESAYRNLKKNIEIANTIVNIVRNYDYDLFELTNAGFLIVDYLFTKTHWRRLCIKIHWYILYVSMMPICMMKSDCAKWTVFAKNWYTFIEEFFFLNWIYLSKPTHTHTNAHTDMYILALWRCRCH